jgi:hypothetical protein
MSQDRPNNLCAVYLIASSLSGPIKVGVSSSPTSRVKMLQTGHAERLRILGVVWFRGKRTAHKAERWLLDVVGRIHPRSEWTATSVHSVSTLARGLMAGKFDYWEIEGFEELEPIRATDAEVSGTEKPRHGAIATAEQIERLGVCL